MLSSFGSLQQDNDSGSESGDPGAAAHQLPAAPWGGGGGRERVRVSYQTAFQ